MGGRDREEEKNTEGKNEADDGQQWSGTQQGKKRDMGNKGMRSEKCERLKKSCKALRCACGYEVCF